MAVTAVEIETTRSLRPLALLAVAGAVVTWGLSGVVIKLVSTSGIVASVYRLNFALPLLWLTTLSRPAMRRSLSARWAVASLAGGVLFAAHQLFFFNALKLTSVANVAIIGALQPVPVLLVAGPWFGERPTASAVGWSSLALLGALLVVVGSKGTPSWSLHGDALAVINLGAFTAYFLVSKHFRSDVGAGEYVVGMSTVAAVIVTALAVLTGEDLASPHGSDWAWLLFLAIVPGTIGHLLSNWAHPHLSAFLISVMLLAVPVIAALAAAVFLAEPVNALQALGGTIVLGAIGVLVTWNRRGAESEELAESVAETDAP